MRKCSGTWVLILVSGLWVGCSRRPEAIVGLAIDTTTYSMESQKTLRIRFALLDSTGKKVSGAGTLEVAVLDKNGREARCRATKHLPADNFWVNDYLDAHGVWQLGLHTTQDLEFDRVCVGSEDPGHFSLRVSLALKAGQVLMASLDGLTAQQLGAGQSREQFAAEKKAARARYEEEARRLETPEFKADREALAASLPRFDRILRAMPEAAPVAEAAPIAASTCWKLPPLKNPHEGGRVC